MLGTMFVAIVLSAGAAFAADSIKGLVVCGGAPIANSTVTLWEASADAPKQLDQTKSSDDGRFEVRVNGAHGDGVLYLVAAGGVPKASKAGSDDPAVVLLSVLGSKPPQQPGITSVIIGATKIEQLKSNLASLDLFIPGELRKKLDDATALDIVHPYMFFRQPFEGRINGGVEVRKWRG
jgi:hypothetical protein